MELSANRFLIDTSFRIPGLGLLVLPASPAPAWLTQAALHTALELRLHRLGQPALALPATIEELGRADQPLARALLLDADPGALPAGAWLEAVTILPKGLL